MNVQDVLKYIEFVLRFFDPLIKASQNHEQAEVLLNELGYAPPTEVTAFDGLANFLERLIDVIDSLDTEIDASGEDADIDSLLVQLFAEITAAIAAVSAFDDNIQSDFAGTNFLTDTNILDEIPLKLLDYLFVDFLEKNLATTHAFFLIFGVVEEEFVEETPNEFLIPYTQKTVHWDRITDLFTDPVGALESTFITDDEIQFQKFIHFFNQIGVSLGLFTDLQPPDVDILEKFNNGNDLTALDEFENLDTLKFPLISDPDAELSLQFYPIIDPATEKFTGIGTGLSFGSELEIPITDLYRFIIELSVNLNDSLGFSLSKDGEFKFISNIFDPSSTTFGDSVEFGSKLSLIADDEQDVEKFLSIGSPNGTRFEIGSWKLALGIEKLKELEIFLETEFRDGKIVINTSESDGFVSQLLPAEDIESNFELGIGISNINGFYFIGSSGFEIQFPAHVELGPIEIQSLLFGVKFQEEKIPVAIASSFSANLGPIAAVVEDIGVNLNFEIKDDQSGNLGPLDLGFDFKPPNGVGLSVDAGPVKGGGYLYFDFDREEYAGALELVFSDWIALRAIGLITTKMPDGSKGFSMLIIITVEFGTGIQLGFGFTLLGVGGLLGINRIVNIEPLKDGIRTGAVESVMFPQDVIANAPKIISDLRKFFPPQKDLFLIGPMAKIGWGTPTLISVSIGIIMEIPSINITILGVVKVVLPDEEADILRLQVNFIGRIEPSNERLWFYAELFDSRVLFITLEGGMGLLVGWGDNANFVVSVGGFHPRYSPPPLPFPEPPRIAVSILNESYAKVRIEAYFAVTSNSVQFGAKAELFFGVSEFNIEGFLAFDALFQFDPFFFSFGLSISLSVKVFGIGLFSVGFSGLLEGPSPWYIEGKGKISLLFFKIKVPFSHTWGEEEDTKLDPIEVFPLIEKELNALTNWVAQLPESSNTLVSLRKLGESEEDQLVLHPVGTLRISQRKIPLDFKMDKVGNQTPSDVNKLQIAASVNGGDNLVISEIQEKFAIGQFKELDDSKRLSSPAFEPLDGGVELAVKGEQLKTSQAVKRVIRYESIIIDNYYKRFVQPFFLFFVAGFTGLYEFLFEHFMAGNAVTKSELSYHHKKRMQPFDEVIQVKPNEYSVAFNINNKPMDGEATSFTSQARATQFMEQKIQDDPKLADELHVIPNTEINTAA